MTLFRKANLGVLNRLYAFNDARLALDEFDLNAQVQPVHDVSREVELASGVGVIVAPGWWLLGQQHTHPGADTQRSALNPRTIIQQQTVFPVPNDGDIDVWYWGVTGLFEETGVGAVTSASSALWYPAIPGRTAAFPIPLWLGGLAGLLFSVSDAAGAANSTVSKSDTGVPRFPHPLFLPTGSILAHMSASSAATTVTIADLLWVGARGARPPGVA